MCSRRDFVGKRLRLESRLLPRFREKCQVVCTGGLKAKGRRHLASDITVKRIMGEGAFGQVFEGVITTPQGEERVVLKRTKPQIPGAEEMGEMEHVLNVYASRVCRDSIADFMGYCGVSQEEATGNLTPGTWLMWKYQGDKTLADYMRRRDTLSALAEDLGLAESDVPRIILEQILINLKGLHSAGLVHRDVKPSNLVFCTKDKKFKFIDLGACADLRLGTNYVPDETIHDRIYFPPEEYVLPTDAPHLSGNAFSMVISPIMWSMHKPDRFDIYSTGLIFFQLAVPTMCSDRALRNFVTSFERFDYDLKRWREHSTLLSRHTQILDANDGAGWDLLEQMLRPRRVEESKDGTVSFADTSEGSLRISVEASLDHPFMKAVDPSNEKPLTNLWRKYTRSLFDLEGQILNRVVETEEQTTTVKKLKSKVAKGQASEEELKREEKKLSILEASLKTLQEEFVRLARKTFQLFGIKGLENRGWMKWLKGGEGDGNKASVLGTTESIIYAGLKFTGLAARIAGDLAKSLKKDAELMFEMSTEDNQKRSREVRDRDFLLMLKSVKISLETTYEDMESKCKEDPAFSVVNEDRRKTLFAAYERALKEKLSKEAESAKEDLRTAAELANNQIFLAVDDPRLRRQIFHSVQAQDESEDDIPSTAESDFRELLKEISDPRITGTSSWPRVKQQLYSDVRYQALPEPRRLTLFQEYREIQKEIESEAEESQRLAELERLKTKAADETAEAEARLSNLMKQRTKLKTTYQKMEANLTKMETTISNQKQKIEEKENTPIDASTDNLTQPPQS